MTEYLNGTRGHGLPPSKHLKVNVQCRKLFKTLDTIALCEIAKPKRQWGLATALHHTTGLSDCVTIYKDFTLYYVSITIIPNPNHPQSSTVHSFNHCTSVHVKKVIFTLAGLNYCAPFHIF